MACRGVHFALTDEQREQLLAIVESQGDVISFIQEDIEEQWDTEWLCETDKAWDAIHRCLTDGTLSDDDSTPFHWCILNGSQMHDGDDYIVSFVDAPNVKQVSEAMHCSLNQNSELATTPLTKKTTAFHCPTRISNTHGRTLLQFAISSVERRLPIARCCLASTSDRNRTKP